MKLRDPRRGMVWLSICIAVVSATPSMSEELVTRDEARKRAQAEMAKLLPEAATVRAVVYDQDVTAHRIRVIFDMYFPDGFWGREARPEAYVDRRNGSVSISAWCDADAEKLPHPQTITQRFLQSVGGRPTDPERAVRLIQRWLTVHRDSDAYEAHLDGAYGHFVRCFQEGKNEMAIESILADELAATGNPKAIYAIHRQLALYYQRRGEIDKAVQSWKQASAAMEDGTHAYFTTRQAIPLLRIGKIYLTAGEESKAIEHLAAYCNTPYAKKDGPHAIELLGDLYEKRGETDKAVDLYRRFINTTYRAINPKYSESMKKPLRERLERLEER